jgi:hypothetical protein
MALISQPMIRFRINLINAFSTGLSARQSPNHLTLRSLLGPATTVNAAKRKNRSFGRIGNGAPAVDQEGLPRTTWIPCGIAIPRAFRWAAAR